MSIRLSFAGALGAAISLTAAVGMAQGNAPSPWASDLLQLAKSRPEPSHTATDMIATWEWGNGGPMHRDEAKRIFAASALVQQAVQEAGAPTFDTYVKMLVSQGVDQNEIVRVAAWTAAVEFHFKETLAETGPGALDCAKAAGAFAGMSGTQPGASSTGMPRGGLGQKNNRGRTGGADRGGAQGGRVVSGVPMCGGGGNGGADIPANCFPGSAGMFGMCALPGTSKIGNVPGFGGTGGSAAMGGLGSTVDPENVSPPGPKWEVQDACTALNPKAVMGGGGAAMMPASPKDKNRSATPPKDRCISNCGPEPVPMPFPNLGKTSGNSKTPNSVKFRNKSQGRKKSPQLKDSLSADILRPKKTDTTTPDGKRGAVKITPPKEDPPSSDGKGGASGRPTNDGSPGAAHEACGQSVVQAMFGCMFPSVGPSGGGGGEDYMSAPSAGGGATAAPEGNQMSCMPGGAQMSPGMPAPESVMSCTCGGFGDGGGMGSGGSYNQNSLADLCSQFGNSPRWANHCGAYDPNPTQQQMTPNTMQFQQQGTAQQQQPSPNPGR